MTNVNFCVFLRDVRDVVFIKNQLLSSKNWKLQILKCTNLQIHYGFRIYKILVLII